MMVLKIFLPLFVLIIGVVLSAAPNIIEWQLAKILGTRGFNLTLFDMPKWHLGLKRLEIEGPNIQVSLEDLSYIPLDHLRINRLKIEYKDTDKQAGDEENLFNKAELRESLVQILNSIYGQAYIDRLIICLSRCEAFSFTWKKQDSASGLDFSLSHASGLLFSRWLDERLELEVSYSESRQGNKLFSTGFIDFSKPGKIQYQSKVNFASPKVAFPKFGVEASNLESSVLFEGSLPTMDLLAPIDLLQDTELNTHLLLRSDVRANLPNINLRSNNLRSSGNPEIEIDLTLNDGKMDLLVTNVHRLVLDNEFVEDLHIEIDEGLSCHYAQKFECQVENVWLRGVVEDKRIEVNLQGTKVMGDAADWQITALVLDAVVKEGDIDLAELKVTDFSFKPETFKIDDAKLSVLGLDGIDVSMHFEPESQAGKLELSLAAQSNQLKGVLDYLDLQDIDLIDGQVEFSLDLLWLKQTIKSINSNLLLENLDVNYQGYRVRNGYLKTDLQGWPLLQSKDKISMAADLIDIGLHIEEVMFEGAYEFDALNKNFYLKQARFDSNILAGRASSEALQFSIVDGIQNGNIELQLHALDLSKLLALEGQDIESSGRLSGSVPIQIKNGSLSVKGGALLAKEPGGFIKYKPSSSATASIASNDSLKLVADVMSDFQYHSLGLEIDYTPDGVMLARTSLKGNNPSYENGREVHFNLNVEENILTLLESLRLSEELSESLDEKIKGRMTDE